MSLLAQSAIFLAAAVCVVPIAKRLGLGAVLGYLAAGIIIGPWGARLITDVNDILHFAELGVVLLLFIIGLELQPSRLWALRRAVFGLGGAQVAVTGALITGAAMVLGLPAGQASRLVRTFRDHDVRRLHDDHASHGDEERMRYLAMESARELEAIFVADEADEELSR